MEITRLGTKPSVSGPTDWFTGAVEEVRPGDVVWFEPNEKHWHGASAANGMSHIAIQENLNGKVVDWMEHVSTDQYNR
jgi:quercetin dioxygenase-like cupin family protein